MAKGNKEYNERLKKIREMSQTGLYTIEEFARAFNMTNTTMYQLIVREEIVFKRKESFFKKAKETMCWECQNTKCSWARKFIPVENWETEKTKIIFSDFETDSYIVISCPEFISECEEKVKFREVANAIFAKMSRENLLKANKIILNKVRYKAITDYMTIETAEKLLNCKIVESNYVDIMLEGE